MMAEITPFPAARRAGYIRKRVEIALSFSRESAERDLQHRLKQQRKMLSDNGIPPDIADREIKALEAAIRAALWRRVMSYGGAA